MDTSKVRESVSNIADRTEYEPAWDLGADRHGTIEFTLLRHDRLGELEIVRYAILAITPLGEPSESSQAKRSAIDMWAGAQFEQPTASFGRRLVHHTMVSSLDDVGLGNWLEDGIRAADEFTALTMDTPVPYRAFQRRHKT